MALIPMFLKEMANEAKTTRKMLERIPEDRYDWKPHEKSMTLKQLALHVAELPGWVTVSINTDGIDLASGNYEPREVANNAELIQYFEESLKEALATLEQTDEQKLNEPWTLRKGEFVVGTDPKGDVIRMSISQTIHHRAQLGVYLRLLNIPVPGSYGPTADENGF